jgi:hypothetical protein
MNKRKKEERTAVVILAPTFKYPLPTSVAKVIIFLSIALPAGISDKINTGARLTLLSASDKSEKKQ